MPNVAPEIRELIVGAKKCGKRTKEIAEFFGVSRKTVWKWVKRAYHPRKESFSMRILERVILTDCHTLEYAFRPWLDGEITLLG